VAAITMSSAWSARPGGRSPKGVTLVCTSTGRAAAISATSRAAADSGGNESRMKSARAASSASRRGASACSSASVTPSLAAFVACQ